MLDISVCSFVGCWFTSKVSVNCFDFKVEFMKISEFFSKVYMFFCCFFQALMSFVSVLVVSATLGTLEFSLQYDQENNALHCTINKAKVSPAPLFAVGVYSSSTFTASTKFTAHVSQSKQIKPLSAPRSVSVVNTRKETT